MANILKVTTPGLGYDNSNYSRPDAASRTDSQIQAPVVPDKVVRPDARSDAAPQEQDVGMKFQYQSNFEGFLTQMRENGSVTEEFAPLLFERLSSMVRAGMSEGAASELSGFLEMIQVDQQNLLSFVQQQGDASIRFQGAFFDLLRQVMGETRSVDLKSAVLDFMKRYTDMAEGKHLLQQMQQTLADIKKGMFESGQKKLEQFERQMNYGQAAGETAGNASVLKEKILPYLNQYISGTHDRGMVRENTAFLASLAARYENGDAERVLDKFKELMESPVMQRIFKGMQPESLMRVLASTDYEKAVEQNHWMEKFAALVKEGMTKGDPDQKKIFRNVMNSIILNESVYMPVVHTMLPMQIGDRMMFAEMWVDPDAGKGSQGQDEDGRVIQGLVKFDIQDVGFFDLFFVYQDKKVNIQLNYPEALKDREEDIRNRIMEIVAENGMEGRELYLGNSRDPIMISDAFPKIFERKNSINVKI